MGPDAMETFTPPDMGGDVDLAEAKRRIGDKVCMIGGFDQFHFFTRLHAGADAGRGAPLLRGRGRRAAATSSARPTTSSTPTRR